MDSQASLLPPEFTIDEAAALYREWSDKSGKNKPKKLDLREHLSRLSNGGREYENQVQLWMNINPPAMTRSTKGPAKKRKRGDVVLTDSSSEENDSRSNSSTETTSTMTTEKTRVPFHHLKWLVTAIRGRKSLVKSAHNEKDGHNQTGRIPAESSPTLGGDFLGEYLTNITAEDHRVYKSAAVKQKYTANFAEQAVEAKPLAFFDGERLVEGPYYERPCHGKLEQESIISRNCDNQGGLTEEQMLANIESYKRQHPVCASGNMYKCNVCDKSFTSHQALGGHKTSHNKRNKNINSQDLSNTDGARPEEKKRVTGDHRCKICGRSFDSGQALGGHQRVHYVPPSKDETPPTSATRISAASQENAPSRKLLGFDLNEPAEMEEEREIHPNLTLRHAPGEMEEERIDHQNLTLGPTQH